MLPSLNSNWLKSRKNPFGWITLPKVRETEIESMDQKFFRYVDNECGKWWNKRKTNGRFSKPNRVCIVSLFMICFFPILLIFNKSFKAFILKMKNTIRL